jgi:polar amino acid transport system substrate-binding protein
MVVSIVAIAITTAGITPALTTRQLRGAIRGAIHGISDLLAVRAGVVAGTFAEDMLGRLRIAHRGFANLQDGIEALQAGKIDALVHDRPLLAWAIRESFRRRSN